MKKLDLHIHTVPSTNKDAPFDFSIAALVQYVSILALDAIAVTNHNLFDLDQFNEIKSALKNAAVFPGIEIDFEEGHLLLIDAGNNLESFQARCNHVTALISQVDKLEVGGLRDAFGDLSKYLLIPHYDKKPVVSKTAIQALSEEIIAGEVSSPKKFYRAMKDPTSLTPVVFSDARISRDMNIDKYQGRQTYINSNTRSVTLDVIKSAFGDKSKVFLSDNDNRGFFQVSSNGQVLASGLNVILGGRSSGKTHFLDELRSTFGTEETPIKYIKQFDLIRDNEDNFNRTLEKEKSTVREFYLKEFRDVLDDIIDLDLKSTAYKLEMFVSSLAEYAANEKRHDHCSNAVLFSETPFRVRRDNTLVDLINAVQLLSKHTSYTTIIQKHLDMSALKRLSVDLENQYKTEQEEQLKKSWVNVLIEDIRQQLESHSSSPRIKYNDIDLYDIGLEKEKIKRFNALGVALQQQKIIDENDTYGKFSIQAVANRYSGAGEIKAESRRVTSFSGAYEKYPQPIHFLAKLKEMADLEKSELYKYFCKVTYHVLNEYGRKISGGEKAEFNLLKQLIDARQYEMLLVDEPESSFDNIFLKDSVNKQIKELSLEMPVVVVTHNSTVGMLMEPDYIIYTRREIIEGKDTYKVFSGSPAEKEFMTADNKYTIPSHEAILDALEAGKIAFEKKRTLYNSYKS